MERRRLGLRNLQLESARIEIRGSSLLRAWEPGVLPYLLDEVKLSYLEAIKTAELWGCRRHAERVKNLIVANGLYLLGDIAIEEHDVGITYHAIGTGTTAPASGNTTINTEVARKLFAARDRSAAVVTCSAFYLGSESNYDIREAGVFGGDDATSTLDSGDLLSHYLQTYDNSGGSPNDLTWDYDLTFAVG